MPTTIDVNILVWNIQDMDPSFDLGGTCQDIKERAGLIGELIAKMPIQPDIIFFLETGAQGEDVGNNVVKGYNNYKNTSATKKQYTVVQSQPTSTSRKNGKKREETYTMLFDSTGKNDINKLLEYDPTQNAYGLSKLKRIQPTRDGYRGGLVISLKDTSQTKIGVLHAPFSTLVPLVPPADAALVASLTPNKTWPIRITVSKALALHLNQSAKNSWMMLGDFNIPKDAVASGTANRVFTDTISKVNPACTWGPVDASNLPVNTSLRQAYSLTDPDYTKACLNPYDQGFAHGVKCTSVMVKPPLSKSFETLAKSPAEALSSLLRRVANVQDMTTRSGLPPFVKISLQNAGCLDGNGNSFGTPGFDYASAWKSIGDYYDKCKAPQTAPQSPAKRPKLDMSSFKNKFIAAYDLGIFFFPDNKVIGPNITTVGVGANYTVNIRYPDGFCTWIEGLSGVVATAITFENLAGKLPPDTVFSYYVTYRTFVSDHFPVLHQVKFDMP